jgi:hypothetical protein
MPKAKQIIAKTGAYRSATELAFVLSPANNASADCFGLPIVMTEPSRNLRAQLEIVHRGNFRIGRRSCRPTAGCLIQVNQTPPRREIVRLS